MWRPFAASGETRRRPAASPPRRRASVRPGRPAGRLLRGPPERRGRPARRRRSSRSLWRRCSASCDRGNRSRSLGCRGRRDCRADWRRRRRHGPSCPSFGRHRADCRPSCRCRRKAGRPRRLRRERIASRAAAIARDSEVALPVGVKAGRLCGPSSGSACSAKAIEPQAEIVLELFAPFRQLVAGLVEPRRARGVVRDAHRGRRVEQEDRVPASRPAIPDSSARAETGASRPAEWPPTAAQKRPELPARQRAERPTIKRPGQQDRHGGNRQHRRNAMTLGEGEGHGEGSGQGLGIRGQGLEIGDARLADSHAQSRLRFRTSPPAGFALLFSLPRSASLPNVIRLT